MDDNELRDRLDAMETRIEAKIDRVETNVEGKIDRVHSIVKSEYTLLELWRRTDKQLTWLFASVGGLLFTIIGAAIVYGIWTPG